MALRGPGNAREVRGGVILAHPGGGQMRSYEIAVGLERAGLLRLYISGFYARPEGILRRSVNRFVNGRSTKWKALLAGRHHPDLPPQKVLPIPHADLAYLCVDRLLRLPNLARRMLRWQNDWFDERVARVLEQERPVAVLGYDGCASRAFGRARLPVADRGPKTSLGSKERINEGPRLAGSNAQQRS